MTALARVGVLTGALLFGVTCAVAGEAAGDATPEASSTGAPPVSTTRPARRAKPAPLPEPEIVLCEAVRKQGDDDEATALVRGSEGWIFRTTDVKVDFPLDAAASDGLSRFTTELRRRGTELAIVLLPPRGALAASHVDRADPLSAGFDPDALRVAYHDAVVRLAAAGPWVPDILSAVDAAGIGEGFFYRRDHHWRPEGARLAMQAVMAAVGKRSPALDFSPVASENRLIKERGFVGSLARRVERECKVEPYPPERYPDYDSVLSAAVTEAALLGDPAPVEVVVAGASHTNKGNKDVFNVAGWLREATGTDVLNIGVDGGGYSTGLLSWLDTEPARSAPPKLLVWEISARIPPGFPDFFRQAIPTLHGPCATPLATGAAAVGSTDVAVLAAPKGVSARSAYAVVDAADPSFVVFFAAFETADGKREEVSVRRSTLLPNSGRFFVEAPRSDAELVRVTVRAGENGASTVKASLCRYPAGASSPTPTGSKR